PTVQEEEAQRPRSPSTRASARRARRSGSPARTRRPTQPRTQPSRARSSSGLGLGGAGQQKARRAPGSRRPRGRRENPSPSRRLRLETRYPRHAASRQQESEHDQRDQGQAPHTLANPVVDGAAGCLRSDVVHSERDDGHPGGVRQDRNRNGRGNERDLAREGSLGYLGERRRQDQKRHQEAETVAG